MKRAPFLAVSVLSAVQMVFPPPSAALRAADRFVRGDVDESLALNLTDAMRILRFLFSPGEGEAQVACIDAADVNDDGALNLTDPIALLLHLFQGGPAPPPPNTVCGPDPTEDPLRCAEFTLCPDEQTFYGVSIDADGIFPVIDRSGTMQDRGELQIAKRETLRVMFAFQPEVQFGIAFFDRGLLKFPSSDQPASAADPDAMASARAFVESVSGGAGTCGQAALLAAVRFAKSSTADKKAIFYVSDGGGTCQGVDEAFYLGQTVEAVTTANAGTAAIHTIGVLDIAPINENFLKDLAERNGGSYTRIQR